MKRLKINNSPSSALLSISRSRRRRGAIFQIHSNCTTPISSMRKEIPDVMDTRSQRKFLRAQKHQSNQSQKVIPMLSNVADLLNESKLSSNKLSSQIVEFWEMLTCISKLNELTEFVIFQSRHLQKYSK
jgi:hypothetical protein